jgi:hypothetical protein
MTDANNSVNNLGQQPHPQPTQKVTWNGSSGGWQTITIPTTNVTPGQTYTITIGAGGGGGGGTCVTGGNLIFQAGTGACPQISFDDIDLAVPVAEKKEISDGCTCRKCKEYYQYAEPNQDDGTLICYGCRMVW